MQHKANNWNYPVSVHLGIFTYTVHLCDSASKQSRSAMQ